MKTRTKWAVWAGAAACAVALARLAAQTPEAARIARGLDLDLAGA
jgi:hypothetical protein